MSNIIRKILRGEKVDRSAVFMVIDNFYYPSLLSDPVNFSFSREAMLETIFKVDKKFNQDGLVIFPYPSNHPYNFFGCKVEYNKYGTPLYVTNSINNHVDIANITIPELGDRLNVVGDVLNVCKDKFLTMPLQSSFELACILRGVNNSYLDFKKNPELMKDVIDKAWEISESLLRQYIKAGVENITIKNSLGSSSLISPEMYNKFSWSYDKKMISLIHELGASATLHICKLSEPLIDMMIDTGADILEIDSPNDIVKIKNIAGDKVILKGNLDAVDDVFDVDIKKIKEKLEILSNIEGLIISTGDSIPYGTSDRNIKEIISFFKK